MEFPKDTLLNIERERADEIFAIYCSGFYIVKSNTGYDNILFRKEFDLYTEKGKKAVNIIREEDYIEPVYLEKLMEMYRHFVEHDSFQTPENKVEQEDTEDREKYFHKVTTLSRYVDNKLEGSTSDCPSVLTYHLTRNPYIEESFHHQGQDIMDEITVKLY